jgi:integrase
MGGGTAPQANLPQHLGELTIRGAIGTRRRFMMLPTLPNDARDGESHSRSASMSRAMGRNQTSERKAMAKKRATKRRAWNKGLKVGKRDGFTPDQVKRIRGLLAHRGVPGLRDLALFSTAIDTMLHGQDLLALVVGDVQRRDGSMRPVIEVARARGMPPVRCALSNASTKALEKWITVSGKKRTDYLFPGRGVEGRHPMGQRQLNRLLKLWVAEAGLDPSDYGVESLRRTKALHIFKRHWRFADSSSAFGPCKNREHREISRSQNKCRPNRGLSGLRYLTLTTDWRLTVRRVGREKR